MKEFKKCKGQGRAKDFNGCDDMVKAQTRQFGLCRTCFKDWATTTPEGDKYLNSIALKAKKIVAKERKKAEKRKTVSLKLKATNWKNELQTEVQKIARFIDWGLKCLARDQNGRMNGGHVYSKGSSANIRFDLHNIHRQSAQSNKWNADDGLFREKLADEYGQQYWEYLTYIRHNRPVPKYSNKDYHQFYVKAKAISNRLKKENDHRTEPRTVQERIELRDKINQEIGIYKNENYELYKD